MEMLPGSAGNKFAIDDVQIVVSNTAKDVQSYMPAAQGQFYLQTSSATPGLQSPGYLFVADVQGIQSNSIWDAWVYSPSGGGTNLVDDGSNTGYSQFAAFFDSQATLNAAYSNGLYRLSILGQNQGCTGPR